MKILSNIYIRNILFLLFFILNYFAQIFFFRLSPPHITIIAMYIFLIVYQYGYVVFHNLVLFEGFFVSKRFWLYLFSVISLVGIDYLITRFCLYLINDHTQSRLFFLSHIVFLYLGLAVYLAFKYFRERARLAELKVVHKEVELSQLKTQLNPHFLYNALNNIYSYLLVSDEGQGKELVLKLSEIMRYLTELADRETVTIGESVNFIRNYIDFEKERLGARCHLELNIDIQDPETPIAPLIMFPLVENAFKFGSDSIRSFLIEIELLLKEGTFTLSIKNEKFSHEGQSATKKGLNNVRRRLQILYPGRHDLRITESGSFFEVFLTIRLA
ncbi:MAG: histidine kinase [Bacteroidota bacterium]